jgi:hypothetical protein
LLVVTLFLLTLAGSYSTATSFATNQNDFSSANNAITSAFVATHNAEEKGGNVSSLIVALNEALDLVERAQSENSTNPIQASVDLQNATQFAEKVSNESIGIAESGSAARSARSTESVGVSVVIILAAVLIYIFGGRIYRRAWIYLYKDYVARPS